MAVLPAGQLAGPGGGSLPFTHLSHHRWDNLHGCIWALSLASASLPQGSPLEVGLLEKPVIALGL